MTARTLRLEREFDCSPEEMWDAWTDPKRLAQWWNPVPDGAADVLDLDLRPGGKFRSAFRVPDAAAAFGTDVFVVPGTFLVVRPPSELHLRLKVEEGTDREVMLKARFEPVGARTRVTVIIEGDPGEPHRAGMEAIWEMRLDKLASALPAAAEEAAR